jgi:3-deoxy-D-manno-octulosonic-acid transferase
VDLGGVMGLIFSCGCLCRVGGGLENIGCIHVVIQVVGI